VERRTDTALVALRRILRITEINARRLAGESGLTISQLLVLQRVAADGKAMPSSLARVLGLKQATITVLVNKLEEIGFVSRRRDTEDRRRIWIELTADGSAVVEAAPDLLQDRFRTQFEQLGDWEQSMIISVLERIAGFLDAESIDASPVLDVGELDLLPVAHFPAVDDGKDAQ
jgi:DNA-binding MarR family transcriptional regulator